MPAPDKEKDAIACDCDAARHRVLTVPELRHLRYFVTVAEELSFSRAADRLHMAASPLSQAIRQLEAELGVDLFVRTTRHVELTEAGRRLLADGAAALESVDLAFANATRAGHGVLGTLRLGMSTITRHELRPALLARLREQAPGIAADVSESTTGALVRELVGRRLDAALTFCLEPTPGLARRSLQPRAHARPAAPRAPPVGGGERAARAAARRSLRGARRGPQPGLQPAPAGPVQRARLRARDLRGDRDLGRRRVARRATMSSRWSTSGWARHVPDRLRTVTLEPELRLPVEVVWREDDDSPVLRTFLDVTS